MWVLRRTDQGGGYVAKAGSASSYTNSVKNMQKFPTKEAAVASSCVGNEVPMTTDHLID